MTRSGRRLLVACGLVFLFLGSGCLPIPVSDSSESQGLVSNNPFGLYAQPTSSTKASYPPGSEETALKVDAVGRKVVQANPQLGLRPLFGTLGSPNPEVFHIDTRMIYVTEGLVKQCKTEAELAAVLSHQLGKMVAEREIKASPDVRSPEKLPPIQMPVGHAGQFHGEDRVTLVEQARFEKANPKRMQRLAAPDPTTLARGYLEKAGFQRTDLDGVAPLLRQAEANMQLERQFKGGLPQSNWAP